MNLFNQISMTHSQILLFNKIKRKGRDEQERQYMFPSLYGNKAVSKRTKGIFKEFDNRHYKNCYTKQLMRN